MGLLERETLPYLWNSRRSDCQFPSRQEAKLLPTARATLGYQFGGVSTTPGGRGFLLLGLFSV